MSSNSFKNNLDRGLEGMHVKIPFSSDSISENSSRSKKLTVQDPLGIGWAWTAPEPAGEVPSILSDTPKRTRSQDWRRRFAIPATLAACLLIGLGYLVGTERSTRRSEINVAYSVRTLPQLGGGKAYLIDVENHSEKSVYVSLVGLNSTKTPIYSESQGQFIRILSGETLGIELPSSFASLNSLLLVTTNTPASDSLAKAIEKEPLPRDGVSSVLRLQIELKAMGYENASIRLVELNQSNP